MVLSQILVNHIRHVIGKKNPCEISKSPCELEKNEKNDKDHNILSLKNEMFCIEKI
jgi:hypothetical protein